MPMRDIMRRHHSSWLAMRTVITKDFIADAPGIRVPCRL
jgi:hypothetical protein